MNSIKIMHCADLHIGAELSSLSSLASERRAEILHTLGTIRDICIERGVELLLIAGDLFDSNDVSADTLKNVKAYFESMPDTFVAITPGNHDYLSADSPYNTKWSKNVHIFKTAETIEINGIHIHSVPFVSAYSDSFSLPKAEDGTNILLMHADLSGGPYNPVTAPIIAKTGMDYVALGHVHKATDILYADTVAYAYCGCPEPLGFDELGPKGVYIGAVSKNRAELEFLPISKRTYETVSLDVSSANDSNEIITLAKDALTGHENNLIKLLLMGECDFTPDTDFINEGLEHSVYYIKTRDCTYVRENLDLIKNEQTLKGIFVNKMLSRIEQCVDAEEKEKLKEALRLGLAALNMREVEFCDN